MRQTAAGFLREAYEVMESLDHLSASGELLDVMQRPLARFGIESLSLHTFPKPSQRYDDIALAFRFPEEWRKIFNEEQYVHVSPAIRYSKKTDAPFWSKDAPYDPEREPRVIEFLQRSADFGQSNGLIFPIPGQRGPIGLVWMAGAPADSVEPNIPILHLMALSAFDRLRRLRAATSPPTPLTVRERDVLAWVANGKSAWEIGEILGIGKRTIDEHVQTAMRKLKAVNRTQAVVVALRERLISL